MNEAPDEMPKEIPEEAHDEAKKEAQRSKDKGCRAGCLTVYTIAVIILAYIFYGISGGYEPAPSRPEIDHGEFPFRLEYEINGEEKIVEDTLIVNSLGYRNTGAGKVRNWVCTFLSGATDIVLLNVEVPVKTWREEKVTNQIVYYPYGGGAYYMEGPHEYSAEDENYFQRALVYSEYEDGAKDYDICYADELYEDFKIKIISWEIAEPISNTFK